MEEVFQTFVEVVTDALGFSHVLLLIDGLDAIYENQENVQHAVAWVCELFDRSETWAKSKTYIKLFIPDSLEPAITEHLHRHAIPTRIARIIWNHDLLVSMLRKRISAASEERFESLDAISTPALTNIEQQIVKNLPPLPRIVLQVTRKAILHYAARLNDGWQLDEEDIRYAIAWYHHYATQRSLSPPSR
jgi:hypothetical protein